MNIWLVVPYEPIPSIDKTGRQLRYGIMASELSKNLNNKITLWTSDFDHVQKKNRFGYTTNFSVSTNYSIKFLFAGAYSKNISFTRIKHNIRLSKEFQNEVKKIEDKPDIIICCMPTLELGEQVVEYANINQIPVIIDIVDIWPDVYLTAFPKKLHLFLKYLLKLEYNRAKKILHYSSSIIAVSETYLNWGLNLLKRKKQQTDIVFPLGYSSKVLNSQEVITCKNRYIELYDIKPKTFVVTFIGQFEKSYDIETVVEAAKYFSGDDRVLFVLAGNGSKFLEAEIESKNLKNLILPGWLNQTEILALLKLSSIGLAAYSSSALQTLPYKPFEYMSAGLPILSSLNGEFKKIIDENGIGRTYIASNVKSFCTEINWFINNTDEVLIMRKRTSDLFYNKYSIDVIYPQMSDHIYDTYKKFNSQKEK